MSDHMAPYAPLVVPPPATPAVVELCRLRLREALAAGLGPLVVLGPPMRVLMRPDPNPFPVIRLWGRRGR